MMQANVFGGLVAYTVEGLCILGAVVMLWCLRALVAESIHGRKYARTPRVATEPVGRVVDIGWGRAGSLRMKSLGSTHF